MARRHTPTTFRATRKLKNGRVLKASDYGYRGWPMKFANGTKKKRPK